MRTANMPAGQGSDPEARDVERFADALERRRFPESADDRALAHDLRLVELMRVLGPDPALDPTADAKARARARLRAAMAEPAAPAPSPAEATAPLAARGGDDTATTVTAEFARIVADHSAAGSTAADPADGTADDDRDDDRTATRGSAREDAEPAGRSRRGRHGAPARPGGRSGATARPPRHGVRRRAATVAVAALVALVAVAVGGDLVSRGALPGDALYAVKRVAETVGLATTFDDRARAQRHLELATTRVDEVERLVARDGAGGVDADAVGGAITDFETATGEGTRALLAADEAPGPAELEDLQAWASDQAARLAVLRPALPAPAQGEVDGSLALLDRLVGRTRELEARADCAEVTSSVVDDLGPLAAQSACGPTPPAGVPGAGPGPGTVPGTGGSGGTGGTGGDVGGGTGVAPGTGRPDTGTPPRTTPGGGTDAPASERPREDAPDEGLLPGLDTGDLPLLPDGDGPDSGSPDSGAPEEDEDDGVSVPLPGVPSVDVPPLLPGQPDLTIG